MPRSTMFQLNNILKLTVLCLTLAPSFVLGQLDDASDALIPVIALVDSAGPDAASLIASWTSFRANWPNRPFCLLRQEGASELFIPSAFSRDSNTIIANVNRDAGDVWLQSDWFDQCNLRTSSIKYVAIMIAVPVPTIEASLANFLAMLTANYFAEPLLISPQADDNWVDPFNVLLLTSVMPSVSPSRIPSASPSKAPSVSPSNYPSVSPSIYPSAKPSISPSRVPSNPPSIFPSDVPSVQPSDAPSILPSAAPSVVDGTATSVKLSLNMDFSEGGGELTEAELEALSATLESYFNANFGLVLSDNQFIGTSATNTFVSQTYDGGVNIMYQSTVLAQFRETVLATDMAAAANTLSSVPLLFDIFSIGDNFAGIKSATFVQTYDGTV